MDGLVPSGEGGLAGHEEGGLPSVAFTHHQDHIEEPVENSLQGLNNTHTHTLDQHCSVVDHLMWPGYDPPHII